MSKVPRRVTARDVAAHAGVSQPTVSLVMSGNPQARIADRTRERVLKAARDLGYRPNMLARGLVQRRSYAFGVIVPNLDNPFFTEVVSGAERVAAEAEYALLLCDARETSRMRHLEALQTRMIDGVIIDAAGAAELPRRVLSELPNVVLLDQPSGDLPGVASDAAAAGRLAAEHLLALGHRELAFLGPATDSFTFRMRERGFTTALRQAGVPLSSERLRRIPATLAGGQTGTQQLLALEDRPTGLFCANDLLALGALKSCLAAGLRVPDDVSIVGCDDIPMACVVTPELTTVAVPARNLGALAVRLLLGRVPGGKARPISRKPLPVRLVVRGTTWPPPRERN